MNYSILKYIIFFETDDAKSDLEESKGTDNILTYMFFITCRYYQPIHFLIYVDTFSWYVVYKVNISFGWYVLLVYKKKTLHGYFMI